MRSRAGRLTLGAAVRWVLLGAVLALVPTTPAGAATLLGLVNTGELFASADNGVTWTPRSTLPVRDAVALQALSKSPNLILASRSGVVYRSSDGGVNWTAVGTVSATDIVELLIRPDAKILLLAATGALYRSTDLGASFTALAALTGSDFQSLAQGSTGSLYALTRSGSVYESINGGANWVAKGVITLSNAVKIRSLGANLYVLSETGDIYRSTDAGANWTAIGTLSQVGMRGLVPNGPLLVTASREGHTATSVDGISWTWQGSINQLGLTALATDEPAVLAVEGPPLAGGLWLSAPSPNPSRGGIARFVIRLERTERISLVLYDLSGRRVTQRAAETFAAGTHPIAWNAGVRAPGLYFVRLEAGSRQAAEQRWVVLE